LGDQQFAGSDYLGPGQNNQGPKSPSSTSALGTISVPFLAINIIGTGLVLFVGNLWSQVFAQWMNAALPPAQQQPLVDAEGNLITDDGNNGNGSSTSSSLRRGFWVALGATLVAVFAI